MHYLKIACRIPRFSKELSVLDIRSVNLLQTVDMLCALRISQAGLSSFNDPAYPLPEKLGVELGELGIGEANRWFPAARFKMWLGDSFSLACTSGIKLVAHVGMIG